MRILSTSRRSMRGGVQAALLVVATSFLLGMPSSEPLSGQSSSFDLSNSTVRNLPSSSGNYSQHDESTFQLKSGITSAEFDLERVPADTKMLVAIACRLEAKDLEALGRKCDLHSLDLGGGELAARHLRAIAAMKGLKSLCLRNTKVGDDSVSLLLPLAKLEALDLSATPLTNASLRVLAQFPKLRSLSIARIGFTNFHETRVSGAPNLSSLGKAEALELLDISGLKLIDEDIVSLQTCKNLRTLVISHRSTNVSADAFIEVRRSCPSLSIGPHVCQARLIRIDTFDDGGIKSIHSIREDQLLLIPDSERARIVSVGLRKASNLEPLKPCTSLQELKLIGLSVSESQAVAISSLSSLRRLHLQDCGIAPSILESLAQLKSLERIRLAGSTINDELRAIAAQYPDKF